MPQEIPIEYGARVWSIHLYDTEYGPAGVHACEVASGIGDEVRCLRYLGIDAYLSQWVKVRQAWWVCVHADEAEAHYEYALVSAAWRADILYDCDAMPWYRALCAALPLIRRSARG